MVVRPDNCGSGTIVAVLCGAEGIINIFGCYDNLRAGRQVRHIGYQCPGVAGVFIRAAIRDFDGEAPAR